MLVIQGDSVDPMYKVLTLKGTNWKTGQTLNTQIAQLTCKGEPIYGRKYRLYTEETQNADGRKYFLFKTAMLGFVNEAQANAASEARKLVGGAELKSYDASSLAEDLDLD